MVKRVSLTIAWRRLPTFALFGILALAAALPLAAAERTPPKKPAPATPAVKPQVPLPRHKTVDPPNGHDWSGSYGGVILGTPFKEQEPRLP
jgi:hypothetical protein